MKKVILIRQPAGLGDIFFCQKIAKKLANHGYRVIWPILSQFGYLSKYLEFSGIEYPTVGSHFDFKNYYTQQPSQLLPIEQYPEVTILNLQTSTRYFLNENGVMYPKYKSTNIDFNDWQDFFWFKRDSKREQRVFEHYNLKPDEDFIFVNRNFASPPNIEVNQNIKPKTSLRVIEMEVFDWTNIFDWCFLLEKAKEIHTVETSICYLVEKLNVTDKLFMYSRNCQTDFNYCSQIYKKTWYYCIT